MSDVLKYKVTTYPWNYISGAGQLILIGIQTISGDALILCLDWSELRCTTKFGGGGLWIKTQEQLAGEHKWLRDATITKINFNGEFFTSLSDWINKFNETNDGIIQLTL